MKQFNYRVDVEEKKLVVQNGELQIKWIKINTLWSDIEKCGNNIKFVFNKYILLNKMNRIVLQNKIYFMVYHGPIIDPKTMYCCYICK